MSTSKPTTRDQKAHLLMAQLPKNKAQALLAAATTPSISAADFSQHPDIRRGWDWSLQGLAHSALLEVCCVGDGDARYRITPLGQRIVDHIVRHSKSVETSGRRERSFRPVVRQSPL